MINKCDVTVSIDNKSSVSKEVTIYKNVRIRNSKIGKGCLIGDESRISECEFDENVEIARRNNIQMTSIGRGTQIGENTVIQNATIGNYCAISWNCTLGGGEHFLSNLSITELKRIFNNEKRTSNPFIDSPLVIGNDVWIAAGAQVLRNVTIGDGAVVGAGAVVTKNVPPYAVVAGVPAKIIKYRFSDAFVKRLLNIKWWTFSQQKLDDCKWCFVGELDEDKLYFLEKIKGI